MCVYIIVCMPVCIFVSVLDMEKSTYERRVEVGIDSVPIALVQLAQAMDSNSSTQN